MIDCFGLWGEKPMMPPPPKVCPVPVGLLDEPNADEEPVEPAPVVVPAPGWLALPSDPL
jgi:hypothetical protein